MGVRIHVFAAPPEKFFVNSFLVETDEGVVLVDTQFLVSTARALVDRLDALAKPLAAVIVTHPHPDHFNGLPIVLEGRPDVPVFANRATIAGIEATRAAKREAWTPVYGNDYPTLDALPDREVGPDETLLLAGTRFRLIDLGAGECADNSIIHIPEADALIVSDLVYNRCHPWLAEHRLEAWLDQLSHVQAEFGGLATVYAGHGPAGGPELFAAQANYIRAFSSLVRTHTRGGELDQAGLTAVVADTVRDRDGWPLQMLVEMNARALAAAD